MEVSKKEEIVTIGGVDHEGEVFLQGGFKRSG